MNDRMPWCATYYGTYDNIGWDLWVRRHDRSVWNNEGTTKGYVDQNYMRLVYEPSEEEKDMWYPNYIELIQEKYNVNIWENSKCL